MYTLGSFEVTFYQQCSQGVAVSKNLVYILDKLPLEVGTGSEPSAKPCCGSTGRGLHRELAGGKPVPSMSLVIGDANTSPVGLKFSLSKYLSTCNFLGAHIRLLIL